MTSVWTSDHLAMLPVATEYPAIPLVTSAEAAPLMPGTVLWDMWPVQSPDGHVASIADGELWMALSAPERGDPARRHFDAKIRLFSKRGDHVRDLGDALPDFPSFYEREWAGSAVIRDGRVTLYYTAAGVRTAPGGYQQRLVETTGALQADGRILNWTSPAESVASDGRHYRHVDDAEGEPGKIKAFRDPAYFRDPADGGEYLVFTASLASSRSDYNGAVGLARKSPAGQWELLPPLVHADGVNNELERAHVVAHDGRYYLFWSTQGSVFAPSIPGAPTGLYGMVAASLTGPYRPLNSSGLVLANPAAEPLQTYSWYVTADLKVYSFVDHWGLAGRSLSSSPGLAASSFGGTPAPVISLSLDGDRSHIAGTRPFAAI